MGAAKTDIQKTQTDLAATNAKLERAIGDLGVQSGLIAHTASELDALKRKGERNYYDFTLHKGARTPVSTVSLQLKKVDPKKSKFTLNVMADDRTIEKKDRTSRRATPVLHRARQDAVRSGGLYGVKECDHRVSCHSQNRTHASDAVKG